MDRTAQHDLGTLLLRVTLGVLILLHGIAKLKGGVGPIEGMLQQHGLPAFLAYGAYIGEVLAPLLVIAGFFARIGAWLIVANMLVALALVHTGDFGRLTEQGGWALELQAMFLIGAAAVALIGPGKHAINPR